jgi:hypothetical protein
MLFPRQSTFLLREGPIIQMKNPGLATEGFCVSER